MSLITQVSYIGKGEVFVKLRTGGARVPIGNVESLELSIEEDRKSIMDYTNIAGGELDAVTRIAAVTGTLKTTNLDYGNLSLATRGAYSVRSGTAVTDEAINNIIEGSLHRTARLIDTTASVVVEKSNVAIASAGNWRATAAGIYVIVGAQDLADDDDITVTYTALADATVEGLLSTAPEMELIVMGLNEARSGKPVIVTCHRMSFDPIKSLNLIGDDFARMDLGFRVHCDSTITTSGLSQYLKVEMAQQAA